MPEITIKPVRGDAIKEFIPELARLRIEVFREFPYLYDGDLTYEEKYLKTYTKSEKAIIVLALDGGYVVGASSGMPMAEETAEVKRPFQKAGFNMNEMFYFGESVLKKSYRGRGLGVRFFKEREKHVLSLNMYKYTVFCAVERAENHPLKPIDYKNLHEFWRKRGYEHHPELHTTFTWKDVDEDAESKKKLSFWMKGLPWNSDNLEN